MKNLGLYLIISIIVYAIMVPIDLIWMVKWHDWEETAIEDLLETPEFIRTILSHISDIYYPSYILLFIFFYFIRDKKFGFSFCLAITV